MKYFIFSIILLMISFSITYAQTELQPLKVGNVVVTFDRISGEKTGFPVVVKTTIEGVTKTSLYRSVLEAVAPIQRATNYAVTPNQILYLFRLANEDAPAWLLKAAKVVSL